MFKSISNDIANGKTQFDLSFLIEIPASTGFHIVTGCHFMSRGIQMHSQSQSEDRMLNYLTIPWKFKPYLSQKFKVFLILGGELRYLIKRELRNEDKISFSFGPGIGYEFNLKKNIHYIQIYYSYDTGQYTKLLFDENNWFDYNTRAICFCIGLKF